MNGNIGYLEIGELDVSSLSRATARPVYIESEAGFKSLEGYKAIYNEKFGQTVDVVSDRYCKIDHAEAFAPILDAVKSSGLKASGRLVEDSRRAWLEVVFDNGRIKPTDGHDILTGFRAKNSYDRSSPLHIEGFGLRLVCKNGMILTRALGTMRIIHVGKKDSLAEKVGAFIYELGEKLPTLERRIEAISSVGIERDAVAPVLRSVGYSKRVVKHISELYDSEPATQWGLYNAATSYGSGQKTEAKRERILEKTEELLYGEKMKMVARGLEIMAGEKDE